MGIEGGARHCGLRGGRNNTRLHPAFGVIAPKDRLEGRHHQIHAARDKAFKDARQRRKLVRQTSLFTTSTQNLTLLIPAFA